MIKVNRDSKKSPSTAPDKSSGKHSQKLHIEYDGIGFIPLEELAKKETA